MKRNKGWDKPPEVRRKISETLKRIGHRGTKLYQKGHPCYFVPTNEKNWQWKGDKVGYFALRSWLTRHYGKPDRCENPDCVYPRKNYDGELMSAPKRYEWVSAEGDERRRDRRFWLQLCPSCRTAFQADKLRI